MNLIADPARLLRELDGAAKIVFDLDGTLYDTRDFERPALAKKYLFQIVATNIFYLQ